MGSIKFYVSDKVEQELRDTAAANGVSLPEYIREKLLGKFDGGTLSVEDVISKINEIKPTKPFFLSDLFPVSTWLGYKAGQRGVIGRKFYAQVVAGEVPNVSFLGMNKRKAQYSYHEGEAAK